MSALEVDGEVYQVAGEPPIAQSNGWGNMTWLSRYWLNVRR